MMASTFRIGISLKGAKRRGKPELVICADCYQGVVKDCKLVDFCNERYMASKNPRTLGLLLALATDSAT